MPICSSALMQMKQKAQDVCYKLAAVNA